MSYLDKDTDKTGDRLVIAAMVSMTIAVLLLLFNQPEPTVTLVQKDWKCLETHIEDDPTTVSTGDITFTVPGTKTVCDHWIRRR